MYKQLMVALVLDPAERDAAFVHEAVAGLGTDDALLVEVLSCMEGPHLVQVRNAYKRMFASDMASDVLGDTSGHFRRFLEHVLAGQRMPTVVATGSTTKLTPVDSADAKRTAQMLFDAGEGKIFGTDEGIFDKVGRVQSPGWGVQFIRQPQLTLAPCRRSTRRSSPPRASVSSAPSSSSTVCSARATSALPLRRRLPVNSKPGWTDLRM